MNMTTRINDLTETEILSAIREMFKGEHVTGINLEPLIDQSQTLGELFAAIRHTLDENQRGPTIQRSQSV
jgi:hypothetical protein